ncbi:hypothetical protein MKX07_004511 [Trichoderma sp. CBMAI-0711]|nr:hypothetical protein MKX07_004511 [Trichoderma sp. CBMAI-0711]
MDYDEYIREALADGVTQEAAELELAETVHAHMNELAKNATAQYEMALEERCRQQGQRFVENRPAAEEFPLQLFTANIKANKLDDNKWVATIKDYLLRHMPLATHDVPPPPAEGDSESHQIMHRVVSIDKEIDKTQPLKKNIPEDAQLFVPLIPVAYFIGVAVAGLVTQTVGGIAYARYQQSKRRPPAVQPPIVILPPQTTPGQPARPGQPGDPPPPPHPPQPEERDRERKRKRDRKRGRDVVRKARSDCFFGYVDRIDKLKHGYEVRVEAITENSLSDELFIRAVEKMSVAAGSPGFGRYRLALVWIYLHAVPPGVTEGTWINFKLNQQNKQLVTKQNFNLEQSFKDGMTRLELLEPRLSFRMFRFESYFEDNHGYVVQTEVQTISKDIAASVVTTLQQAFGSFNAVGEAVRDLVQKIVHSDTSGKGYLQHLDDDNKTTESRVQPPKPAAPMVSAAKVPFFSPATVDDILGALLPNKADIIAYHVYDVGQGHSARAFDKYGAAFANDFGYGKLDDEDKKVCYHMIRGQAAVPILLSHWDADHYRIGKSSHAKDFSGSADDITLRPWIAPGRSHITGTVSNETAWLIQQNGNLHQWTDSVDYVQMKNVTVVRCMRNNQFNYPDKNNFGALALFVGKGDNLLLFPGDANFESIPEISSADGLVRSVIATHHGSTRSLGTGTKMGASIPKASSSGETYAVFSYSQGNSYGHDIANAYPYYEKKGYGEPETTARLGVDGNDTLELAHFGTGWDKKKASPIKFHFRNNQLNASTISFADNQLSGVVAAEEEAMDEQGLDSGEPAPAAGPAIRGSKLPEPPSDWQAQAQNTPAAKLHDKYQRSFPEVITLTGSGGADPNHDDLADYAIKDADGDVVFYDITAAKVVMDKLPLNVPCKTDYPVTVQITCQDIELVHDAANKEAILPLVRFNVASGRPSDHPASPGTNGMQGDAGYAGGRLRLAVAGEWLGTTQVLTSSVMGVSVQYRGGHGGNGQKGGAETQPKSGGLVVILEPVKGSLDGSGDGGDAGEPGTVPDSEILAVAGKWPQGWKVQLDLGQPGTDSEFGRPGAVGKGGGFSIDMGGDFMPGDKFMFHGTKFSGADGKPFDRSKAQFLKAQAKLTMVATESEMLSLMAPVDWRYLS